MVRGNKGIIGDRVPAVWFDPGQNNERKISIDCAVNSNTTQDNFMRFTTTRKFPLHKWIKVSIKQFAVTFGYTYSIFVDDVDVYRVNSTETQIFDNVKVYATGQWGRTLNGRIRNLIILTNPPGKI